MKQAHLGASWEETVDTMARFQGFVPVELDRKASWTPYGFQKQRAQFDRIYLSKANGKAICLDAKTTKLKRFPCDKVNSRQLEKLMEVGEACPSGYLVLFRTIDQVIWFSWHELFRIATGPEKSLKPDHGINLGGQLTFRLKPIFDLR